LQPAAAATATVGDILGTYLSETCFRSKVHENRVYKPHLQIDIGFILTRQPPPSYKRIAYEEKLRYMVLRSPGSAFALHT